MMKRSFCPIGIIASALLLSAAAVSTEGKIRVACVGNSITDKGGYVEQLQKLLGDGYLVQNCGRSGKTVLRQSTVAGVSGPYWESDRFPLVFSFRPEIITILLGTNDAKNSNWPRLKELFFRDYNALIDTFLTIPTVKKIYICLPTPVFPNAKFDVNPGYLNSEVVPIVDSVARSRTLPLIDCHTRLLAHRNYFSDDLHLNNTGAAFLAGIFYDALTAPDVRVSSPMKTPLVPCVTTAGHSENSPVSFFRPRYFRHPMVDLAGRPRTSDGAASILIPLRAGFRHTGP